MFFRFFIDRPIIAAASLFVVVLSAVVGLVGGIALFTRQHAAFIGNDPLVFEVITTCPGSSPEIVADVVGAPIEQQIAGVENLHSLSSQCRDDGSYVLTVTFRSGTDPEMARVLLTNRVSLATPLLPESVRQSGVTIRRQSIDEHRADGHESPNSEISNSRP